MKAAVHGLVVAAFAVALGHLLWQACLGPPPEPGYVVGGEAAVLAAPEADAKHLYLRRTLYLSQPPCHAWIQVLARDRLEVLVNGKLVQRKTLDGFPVAVVADLTPFLQTGPNVIAIHAMQSSVGRPPVVAVDGAYQLDDGEHPLRADTCWRYGTAFERKASWWFTREFDERHWPFAAVKSGALHAKVKLPPRAVQAADVGRWITPPEVEGGGAALRREFAVEGRPREAWLRVTASSAYRLAVNGILLDRQEDQLGVPVPAPPVRRLYDITRAVHSGRNVLAVAVAGEARLPHLLADVEVVDDAGRFVRFGSDEEWTSRPGLPPDWLREASPPGELACHVEAGDLNMPPWSVRRQVVEVSLPWPVVVQRLAGEAGLVAVIALIAGRACRSMARRLPSGAAGVVALALVPATLAVGAGVLATYDPRVTPRDVYRPLWVFLAVASVAAQWGLLVLATQGQGWLRQAAARTRVVAPGQRLVVALLAALLLTGFWVRVRAINLEPLQWDEVENYHATRGFLQRGFPSMKVHDDLPILYTHTSELEFVPHTLVALVCDSPRIVLRFPGVCFGTLTIGLIFIAGRRLFNTPAGLVAATLYTFAPTAVSMCTIGRYFAQLQFVALLTGYCLWLTVRGAGPLPRRPLWLTVAGFVAMFLTWEASALVAPSMVLAALVQRRGRLRALLAEPAVWTGGVVVGVVVLLQRGHAALAQTQFLWYGMSLSDVRLIPMWRYQGFQPWYYLWESSWNQDALLPLVGLLGAVLLAVRSHYCRPARFLLLLLVPTGLLMACTLPNTQFRYVYHLMPLLILLDAAAFVALARSLAALARGPGISLCESAYGRAVGTLVLAVLVAFGGGMTVELREMDRLRVEGISPDLFKYPDLGGPARYVRDHLRAGDVVLAPHLYQVYHLMGASDPATRPPGYTLVTGPFFLPATLTDHGGMLVDRRDGAPVIASQEQLEDLFARHPRIWYIVQPGQHNVLNAPTTSAFLREHMEVVYEDWETLVLFRGDTHRPVYLRLNDEKTLNDALANFLP